MLSVSWRISIDIGDAFEKKEYLPTVVMQIFNAHGALSLVRSVNCYWDLPQGSIKLSDSENLFGALSREARENMGIAEEQLTVSEYLGFEDLDIPTGANRRLGFTKGNRYFFVKLLYRGDGILRLNKNELDSYVWVDEKNQEREVHSWLKNLPYNKRELTLRHLFPVK